MTSATITAAARQRTTRRFGAMALLVVVVVAAIGVMVTTLTAHAVEVERIDVVLEFQGLRPGVARVEHYPVDVPVDARLAHAGIVRATGIAEHIDWTIELCGPGTCREFTAGSIGSTVARGTYDLKVTAVLERNVDGDGQAVGNVQLVAAEPLPRTGAAVAWAVAFVAVGAVLIGFVMLLMSRTARES